VVGLEGRIPLGRYVYAALAVVCALALAACGDGASGDDAAPAPTSTTVPLTPTPEPPDLTIFRGFMHPVPGACLPQSEALMPNAPREYRAGTHEGVDYYQYDNCVDVTAGAPVVAAKDGAVIRADHDYTPLTQAELDEAARRIAAGEANAFDVVDLFRGQQVWIDHGKGIVTRYAHLAGIAGEIVEGARVVQGQTIAFVGDSGTPESISNPGQEVHLHFEVRVGDSYLGAGAPYDEMRMLYEQLFEPWP
jgi:murein DD-endopeptidase MepM/ murein hydrolase activator NlpD